jgi:NAD(P)H-dependent flavin oxidoreductase YrpB (nitropropane dioxygenase family)
MNKWKNSGFNIRDLKISVPIIQGGMGIGVSLSKLASTVANQGGVGVISAAGIGFLNQGHKKNSLQSNIDSLRKEIRKAKSMTNGVLGVNIMVALSNFDEFVKTALEEKIDIIFSGAGLPLNLPGFLTKGCNTKLIPIVSSAKAVTIIYKWWTKKYNYVPDAFVIEGPMAGGHLGFKKQQIDDPKYKLENLVSEVSQELNKLNGYNKEAIPIIAAGGIFSGGDIYKFLSLGASAVQMATRFVATEECDASEEFKKAYVNCKKEDIGIIESPVGLPGRALINDFLNNASTGKLKPKKCVFNCITTCKKENSPYCISSALINSCKGNLNNGFAFIGANGYRIDKIEKVSTLFNTLWEEYQISIHKSSRKEITK